MSNPYLEEGRGHFVDDDGSTYMEEDGIILHRWPVRMSEDRYCDYCPHFGDPNVEHCGEGK